MTPGTRLKLLLFAASAVLLGIAAVLFFASRPPEMRSTSAALAPAGQGMAPGPVFRINASAKPPRPRTATPESAALEPLPPAEPEERSSLADRLHEPTRSGVQDLGVVYDLFARYREAFRGFPTGEDNASIVNALAGNNPRRVAFLPRDHPAINARGELVDRWQTPFFFHLQSSEAIEIRSAGPDRAFYTADDLLKATPQVEPQNVAVFEERER